MKILFLARHYTYFRNFESGIRELSARGHVIHLAVDRADGEGIAARLAQECCGVTYGMTPDMPLTRDAELADATRLGLDYLRYQDPSYDEAPILRQRASHRTPRAATWLSGWFGRQRTAAWLRALERAVPPPAAAVEFVRRQQADVVLITPLVELGSPQVDYLRAARGLGLRTALCVWSWDHLTSKALIRVRPDRVLVWNATQQREAIDLHGVPADEVIVTGAQCFDQWFDRRAARDREAFCRRAGLRDARPFVLYVCSALFKGSAPEWTFVRRWLRALRGSCDPDVRDVPVLVRPHPQRLSEWDGVDVTADAADVTFFGSNPIDPESRDDYFDSMYHAAAVVGLNTSALIESAIVDRPVYTVLLPELHDNQEGTLHFRYLLRVGDGFLHAARSLDEHASQVADGLRGIRVTENRAFVREFIRPCGVDVAATPRFVEAVEVVAALPASTGARDVSGVGARAAGAVLKGLIWTRFGLRWLGDPRRDREAAEKSASVRERGQRYAAKRGNHRALVWRRRRQRVIAAAKTGVLRTGLVPGRPAPPARKETPHP